MNKEWLIERLKSLLCEVVYDRLMGASETRRIRMHGFIDGYMQALQDAGICSGDELATVVKEQRRHGAA